MKNGDSGGDKRTAGRNNSETNKESILELNKETTGRDEFKSGVTKYKDALKDKKTAIVCDWLTNVGGAEKVLLRVHQLFPDAPIYTSRYSPRGIDWFKDADVRTGWLQVFPSFLRRVLGPLRQRWFSHLDLSEYDLVISVTGAEAKAVKTKKSKDMTKKSGAVHICYCHAPTQYYWQMYDEYIKNPGFGVLNPLVRFFFKLFVKPLRKADFKSAEGPDQFVTISRYTEDLIHKYYKRDAVVVHPPVEVKEFRELAVNNKDTKKTRNGADIQGDEMGSEELKAKSGGFLENQNLKRLRSTPYYITTSRHVNWKRLDLAILACKKLNKRLLVIGEGPETKRLKRLARSAENTKDAENMESLNDIKGARNTKNADDIEITKDTNDEKGARITNEADDKKAENLIEFLPLLPKEELAKYLAGAEALIFPSYEPFGIAPVEALAVGCPVVALGKGGALDYVEDGKNGVLFKEQSVSSLISALKRFESLNLDKKMIRESADKFAAERFDAELLKIICEKLNVKSRENNMKASEEFNKGRSERLYR